mgnify:CR=1 FL=1
MGRLFYDRRIPDYTLTIWYQITHYLLALEHARARVRPHHATRPRTLHARGELEAANAAASWKRAGHELEI